MNRNRMLVIAAIALILSAAVTYMAYRVLKTRVQPVEVTTKVVTASKKLELGALIKKEDVQLIDWPRSSPLEGSFDKIELVVDRALIMPVQVNEPILESKLAPKEAGAGLTAIIPEGMRALTIQVNSIIGVAGFVLPGSRVDLILIAVPPGDVKGAKAEQASKIILENLEVLAAGQNVQRDVNGKPQSVQDVTLLLTPEQASKVALATGDGRIQLALRNPMDKEAAEPPLIVRSVLYTGPTMEGNPKDPKDKLKMARKVEEPQRIASAAKTPARKIVAAKKPPMPAPVAKIAPPPAAPVPLKIQIEVIQGTRRATQSFEEDNSSQEKKP